jgi:hypothetical protein
MQPVLSEDVQKVCHHEGCAILVFDQDGRQSFQIVIQERMQQTFQCKEYGIADIPTDEESERFGPMIIKLSGDSMIQVAGEAVWR